MGAKEEIIHSRGISISSQSLQQMFIVPKDPALGKFPEEHGAWTGVAASSILQRMQTQPPELPSVKWEPWHRGRGGYDGGCGGRPGGRGSTRPEPGQQQP